MNQEALDCALSMSESSPHLRRDEQRIDHSTHWFKPNFIFDVIAKTRSRNPVSHFRCELVPVMPTLERASPLVVGEKLVRREADNLRL